MSCTNCGCDQPLNDLMDIDHVITVDEGGHVTEPQGIYAPELEMEVDGDGQILDEHEADYKAEAARQGWELLEGFTGQHAYRGPVMHPSEYVGGRLADHIRETPGTYVVIVVRCSDGEDAGWAVAYRPPPECDCTVPPGGPLDVDGRPAGLPRARAGSPCRDRRASTRHRVRQARRDCAGDVLRRRPGAEQQRRLRLAAPITRA